MKEITGNLWSYHDKSIIVITTNGYIKKNGECVMGRGCAKEAKDRYPEIAKQLGNAIRISGNHVHYLRNGIISFPVKYNFWEKADLELIDRSAQELVKLVNFCEFEQVVMGRPGCGNGGRSWINEVKPILEKYFDDRFLIIDFIGS